MDDNPADVGLATGGVGRGQASKPDQRSAGWPGGNGVSASGPGSMPRAVRPDLVILDLNLPKKDGRAVLAEIKADTHLRTIPIVVFSTSRAQSDIARSYELGANCYVSKPGNLNGLFLAMQSIERILVRFREPATRGRIRRWKHEADACLAD